MCIRDSPNIDDFAKIREKNGYVTIPNPNLAPEKAFTVEATVGKELGSIKEDSQAGTKSGSSLKVSATVFNTEVKDALVRKNFNLPDGSNTIAKSNEILETQSNVNAERATIRGVSGNLRFSMADKWILASSINYTKGTSRFQDNIEGIVIDTLVPFAHIPPLYGRTSLTFQTGKIKLEGVIRYNGRKRPTDYAVLAARVRNGVITYERTGTSDNIDYSPYGPIDANGDPCQLVEERGNAVDCQEGYAGSLAWLTYNLYGDYQLNDKFSNVDAVGPYILGERAKKDQELQNKLTTSLKVDKDANMGLISDIKQELRKVNALKINYTTVRGDAFRNLEK